MKIDIDLSKNNSRSVPRIKIECDGTVIYKDMINMKDVVSLLVPDKAIGHYELRISRDEPFDGTTHKTWIQVESIMIDNFWQIGKLNHWSKTEYAQEYVSRVQAQDHSWELTAGLYNDTLFYNGSLIYEITAPVRKMFWT